MGEEMIFTTKGDLPLSSLIRTDGRVDTDMEHTTWTEYRLVGDPTEEIVRRDVHVTLTQIAAEAVLGKL
jgi:hypothetical protein